MNSEIIKNKDEEIQKLKTENLNLHNAIQEIADHRDCTSFVYSILTAHNIKYMDEIV